MGVFKLTVELALVAGASPVQAEQWWVVIQKGGNKVTYFADGDSVINIAPDEKSFWTHAFYEAPQDGMKSAKVEYLAHCANRTLQELRYVDYDAANNVIGSGDNTDQNSGKPIETGSVGDRLLNFACSSPSFRKSNYVEISQNVDYRQLGEFYSDPDEIVKVPNQAPAQARDTEVVKGSPVAVDTKRYNDCVLESARRFVKSKETAPVIGKAAVASCSAARANLIASFKTSLARSDRETSSFIRKIDAWMTSGAELEVVKLRSK